MKYLNAPPLDVPPDYDPNEAFKLGVEKGDWGLLETAARKVCRLIIGSVEKSQSVKRWLLATQVIGSREWNNLIIAISRETPDISREIHKLHPSVEMLWWSIANATKVIREKAQ